MKAVLSLVAVAALAMLVASPAKAQAMPGSGVAKAGVHHHHYWQPRKHTYGKRMRAHWGPRCKMSGSC